MNANPSFLPHSGSPSVVDEDGDETQHATGLGASAGDAVNSPAHYQGAIECIDAIQVATAGLAGFEGYCTGNVLKYIWRWKRKAGVQDLKKAQWYLNRLIGALE